MHEPDPYVLRCLERGRAHRPLEHAPVRQGLLHHGRLPLEGFLHCKSFRVQLVSVFDAFEPAHPQQAKVVVALSPDPPQTSRYARASDQAVLVYCGVAPTLDCPPFGASLPSESGGTHTNTTTSSRHLVPGVPTPKAGRPPNEN